MHQIIRQHSISFIHAFHGLVWALRTQPNYRVHILLSLCALVGGWYYRVSYEEFLAIVVLIVVGLVIETVNTAIECTNDAIDTAIRPDIKIAKDVAAGAMLLFAMGSCFVACIIFIPKIW